MKSVLISIQPKWCELIASGKKTVEVRKTKPKLEVPFKCYIYCTKDNTFAEKTLRGFDDNGKALYYKANKGKVIGEFVCDRIITAPVGSYCRIPVSASQVDVFDLLEYADEKTIYGWHISDLVIYDKPRALSEFKQVRAIRGYHKKDEPKTEGINIQKLLSSSRVEVEYLTRPPQSWCYVESERD